MIGKLKFKLYKNSENKYNDLKNIKIDFLKNRDIENPKEYLSLDHSAELDYGLLDNIGEAVELFLSHFDNNDKIQILIDEDVDGNCCAAMKYSYIKRLNKDYPVGYILHKRTKAHGLEGLDDDVIVDKDTKLLIVPDAGTNDVESCKTLKDRGVDVLILDHHEQAKDKEGNLIDNPYALIVNNQMSEFYTNKSLCGAGIVYKFLKALDDFLWCEYADDFLDLVALANISDVMDMRSPETKYLVEVGLHNISNKFFQALINAQEYSMGGIVNIHNVQWYITPILNGCTRFGSPEEKELMFKAFIEQDAWFEYKKRATKDKPAEVIQESIYDRAARLAKNAKARQDKSREKSVQMIFDQIGENPNDKVIMCDVSELLDGGMTGVCAIKVAEKYNRPCLLLKKHYDYKTNTIVFGGSGRNINHSPIESFRDLVESNNQFNFAQGHKSAFGIEIPVDNVEKAKEIFNDELKDEDFIKVYLCDFIIPEYDVNESIIYEMTKFTDLIGQGIEEPMIAITDIEVNRDDITIQGKNEDSYCFKIGEIKFVQFKCKDDNSVMDWLKNSFDNVAKINIVGNPCISEYQGIKTLQFVIDDVDVLSTSFEDIEDNDEYEDESW